MKESLLALDSGLAVAQSEVGALRIALQTTKGGGLSEECGRADGAASGAANTMGGGMELETCGDASSGFTAQAVERHFFQLAENFVVRLLSAQSHHPTLLERHVLECTIPWRVT